MRTNREAWFDMLPRERDVMIEKLLFGKQCSTDYSPKGARKFTSDLASAMMLLAKVPQFSISKRDGGGFQVRTVTYERDETATDWYPNPCDAISVYALRIAGIEVENGTQEPHCTAAAKGRKKTTPNEKPNESTVLP
jgi:hypothetical protein